MARRLACFASPSHRRRRSRRKGDGEAEEMSREQEEKYFEWRSTLVQKLEGIELNLEGSE